VPGFGSVVWFGVLVPRGVSDEIAAKMNAAVVKAVARPGVRKLSIERNVEPESSTPAELEATIRAEPARWEPVVKRANLKE
jgi:tripartite-type tricarboxylate transporter receptor subunit TctC